jgi:hypothetical protein
MLQKANGVAALQHRVSYNQLRSTIARAKETPMDANHHPDHTGEGRPRWPRLRRGGLVVATLLAVALLAAACGSGASGPGVAKSGPTTPPTAGSSGSDSHRSALAYAACVRSHGVSDFPDPSPSGGFNITNNPNEPKLQAAQQACGHLLPGGGQMTTGNKFTPSQVAQLLDYAKCMRAHGLANFPDPTSSGLGALNGIDPNSPHFNAASQACQSLLPNLGGNGPVSRPGGGS